MEDISPVRCSDLNSPAISGISLCAATKAQDLFLRGLCASVDCTLTQMPSTNNSSAVKTKQNCFLQGKVCVLKGNKVTVTKLQCRKFQYSSPIKLPLNHAVTSFWLRRGITRPQERSCSYKF